MPKLLLAGFLLLAFSLVLAGCGGDETSTPASTRTPTPTFTAPPAEANVDISDFAFVPETLEVPVGTRVTWTNSDSVAHTVSSRDALFDSGNFSGGSTFSYTFDQSGTFEYYCKIHPFMTARIIVE